MKYKLRKKSLSITHLLYKEKMEATFLLTNVLGVHIKKRFYLLVGLKTGFKMIVSCEMNLKVC